MGNEGEKNKKLLEVFKKDVAVIGVEDGWILKFDSGTLQALLDAAEESGEGSAIVFVKTPLKH